MILDIKANRQDCYRYEIFDAQTGEKLKGLGITYADDELGYYRCLAKNEHGMPKIAANSREFEITEHWRPIKIRLKENPRTSIFRNSKGARVAYAGIWQPEPTGSNVMASRIMTVGIPVGMLLSLARRLVLPADAKIVGSASYPFIWDVPPDQCANPTEVRLVIQSQTFAEVGYTANPPHLGTIGAEAPTSGGSTLTLTVDQLRELAYDADRQPGRRVAIEVQADGTWTTKGAY